MTTKDVLALALEALERIVENGKRINSSQIVVSETVMLEADEAITAIKQAKDVALINEGDMPITPETGNGATPTASAITAGNGQQAQEPVKMVTPYITQEHFDRVFPDIAPKQAEPAIKESLTAPNGYKLVPVEPTQEMIVALMCTGLRNTEYKNGRSPKLTEMAQGYRAMLAAAPTTPEAA